MTGDSREQASGAARPVRRVQWITAALVTFAAVAGMLLLKTPLQTGVMAAGFAGLITLITRSLKLPLAAFGLSMIFALPLLAIHGILNPQFPVTQEFFHLVPMRLGGIRFAANVSLRVLTIFVAGAAWLRVDGEQMMSDLPQLGAPFWLVAIAAQALAIGALIRRRAAVVYDAQQARGIRVGPDFAARIAALPKIMIPIFVGVIVEAETRSGVLLTRGFSSGPAAAWTPVAFSYGALATAGAAAAIVAGATLF